MGIIAKEIQEKLRELQPVYDEIQQKYKRWKDLQTLEQAIVEYNRLTEREEKKLQTLKQRERELKEERRRLMLASDFDSDGPARIEHYKLQSRTLRDQSFGPTIVVADRFTIVAVRKRLQKFVHRLRLDNTILGQINRIADDIDRPLGEALILLDWNVFVNRAAHESTEVYLGRLIDWSEALLQYHSRLTTDIDNLETRFRRWLHIWELWYACDWTPQDKANWTSFISGSCRAMQEECNRLEKGLANLVDEIGKLKAHLQNTEEIP